MKSLKEFTQNLIKPPHYGSLRKDAEQKLDTLEFPDRKTEAWKYTRVASLARTPFTRIAVNNINSEDFSIPHLDSYEIVFVNGMFQPGMSSYPNDENITIDFFGEGKTPITDKVDQSDHVFSLLNQAYFTDGLFLKVSENITLTKPIHVIHISSGDHVHNQIRHRIELLKGSEAQIILSSHSTDENIQFNNTVIEGKIKENAGLKLIQLQDDNLSSYNICKTSLEQANDSRFMINTLSTGSKLTRNDLEISVDGKNCETILNGAYISGQNQHIDNHTVVDHTVADCYSNELYKGVMGGKSTGVFNGKVYVRKNAQRINAFQSNANILLGDHATINTKPELEIYADDVKCSHGTTTGQLDEEAVFYLRARGLSEKSAKTLLVSAFVKETIENIEDPVIYEWLESYMDSKFNSI